MEYKYAAPADKLSFDFKETLKFDERSLIHKTLCSTTDFLCFKEWAADVKIDIPSIAAKTVEILAICHQDGVEAYHLEVNNKAAMEGMSILTSAAHSLKQRKSVVEHRVLWIRDRSSNFRVSLKSKDNLSAGAAYLYSML